MYGKKNDGRISENTEKMKRMIVMALLCLCAGCGDRVGKPSDRSVGNLPEADASIRLTANENYLRLQRALDREGTAEAEDSPEYYGGSSVGSDGRLTVRIVGDTAEGRAKIAELMGDGDFDVQPCRFSYRRLEAAMDSIDRFMIAAPEDDPVRRNVVSVTMMPNGENHIAVGLLDDGEEPIEAFRRRVLDSPVLVFERAEPVGFE